GAAHHVYRSARPREEYSVNLPAAENCFVDTTPVGEKGLSLPNRQLIGAAENKIVTDIAVRRGDLSIQVVGILREIAVQAQIEGSRAVVQIVPVGIVRKKIQVSGDALREFDLQRIVFPPARIRQVLDLS